MAHFSAAETRSHGLSFEAGQLLVAITTQQKFYIKTKNGVSTSYYSYSDDSPVWGLGQGISWAGSCWQFTATTLENCLKNHCSGAILTNPVGDITVEQFMKFFIDDTTKICNTTSKERTLLEQTTFNMQKHSNFVASTGGSLALDKCRFFLVNFEFDDNHDPYMLSSEELPGELIITDILTGSEHAIKRVEPHEARKTLGCFVSPSHNQIPQFQALKQIILEWKKQMTFSSLSNMLILQAYETILKPKLVYRFSTTSLSFDQCEELVRLIRPLILHAHRAHQTFPKVILEASSLYGGFNMVHFYDIQGYEKLKFMKYHMQLQDSTGVVMLLSLQYTQMMIGVERLFFNLPYNDYAFLTTHTWLTNLWEFVDKNSLSLEIKQQFLIPFQRHNDCYIMDILHPHFSSDELIRINKIRISLKLLFLSDVADNIGRHILPDIPHGHSYRQSNLTFPHQTYSRKWLPLWNKACCRLQKYISSHTLGVWTNRYFSWNTYISPCRTFVLDRSIWFKRITSNNIYKPSPAPNISLATIPIDIMTVDSGIQIVSHPFTNLDLQPPQSPPQLNTFQLFGTFERVNENQIVESIRSNKARLCCDGSVKNKYGAFAYGISQPRSDKLLLDQHAPVHGDLAQITSTRCELMGILACLEYLQYLSNKFSFSSRHFILLIADNSSAIAAPRKNYSSIKYTFSPDMDIILHIQFILKRLPFNIKFNHVKGHQDKNKSYESLSSLAKLNVQMDHKAKAYFSTPTDAPQYDLNSPSFPGEIVSISDPHSRIISRFRFNLRRYSTGSLAESYMAKKLGIPQYRLSLLDWENFSKAHASQTTTMKSFITKSIYQHLPTSYRQHKWKQIDSSLCPLCSLYTETPDHLFQCTNFSISEHRRKQIKTIRDELSSLGTDPFIQRHILRMLLQFLNGFDVSPITTCTDNPEAVLALNEQLKVGLGNFMRGIVVWRLGVAQQKFFRSQRNFKSTGDTWSRKLISLLFLTSHSIWTHRCTETAEHTETSFEHSIRNRCKTLLIQLSRNPHRLPVDARHLIKRKPAFTSTSTLRALQSWASRINMSLSQAKSGQKRSVSDIRNWVTRVDIPPPSSTEVEVIEFSTTPLQFETDEIPDDTIVHRVPNLPFIPYQSLHTRSYETTKTIIPPTPSYRDI